MTDRDQQQLGKLLWNIADQLLGAMRPLGGERGEAGGNNLVQPIKAWIDRVGSDKLCGSLEEAIND